MSAFRRTLAIVSVVAFAASLSACGDTWRGVKQDTGENMKATGQAIEKGGEKVKP
jgi:predicted small secreted protein